MTGEPSIQFRPAQRAQAGGFGFDDAGECVPTTEIDFAAMDGETVENDTDNRNSRESVFRLLHFLADGLDDPQDIGRRVLMTLHQMQPDSTLRDLASRMQVTEARACQLYKTFKNLSHNR